MKTILIDIDNTIGNLIKHYLSFYNYLFQKSFNLECLDTFNNYDFPSYTNIGDTTIEVETQKMHQIFNSKDFWGTIPMLPHATEVLNYLNVKYDIYLLTAPSFESTYFFSERIKWVKTNLPFFDYKKLIFCKNKNLFKSNFILIDDYPANLETFNGKTVKIKYKFNSHIKTNGEFFPHEWEKVPHILKLI
jgi:5'(3')-deoxyribonucleotidase